MKVIRCPASPAKSDLYWSPAIWREIARSECDLVHVQGWHTFVAPTAMAAAIRFRRPFVLTFHSGGHSSASRNALRGLQTRLLRPLARRAHQLIGVSRFEADNFSLRLGIPRERFVVIGNGAQMPTPQSAPSSEADSGRSILSVGRLERYKGHHRVIEALPLVLARMPDVRLRVAGDGPYEGELRALVERLGLNDKVIIGKIPPSQRDAMADAMSRASLVTLISEYEAHPVAVMEAVSLGTPVLTTDTSGFIELAEQGLVRTVPLTASTEALAQAILEGIVAPRRPVALVLPDWEDCTSKLLLAYKRILSKQD
jgi:glycosyltransferase involved in cell wall biosynthesis